MSNEPGNAAPQRFLSVRVQAVKGVRVAGREKTESLTRQMPFDSLQAF
jgi:hypothetical protein